MFAEILHFLQLGSEDPVLTNLYGSLQLYEGHVMAL